MKLCDLCGEGEASEDRVISGHTEHWDVCKPCYKVHELMDDKGVYSEKAWDATCDC